MTRYQRLSEPAQFSRLLGRPSDFGGAIPQFHEWVVLYAHCEFFGGEGTHAAIAWHQDRVVFGPCFTRTPTGDAEPHHRAADRPDMAINSALRSLGIHAADGLGEFDSIGLGKHRWTDDWVT